MFGSGFVIELDDETEGSTDVGLIRVGLDIDADDVVSLVVQTTLMPTINKGNKSALGFTSVSLGESHLNIAAIAL